MRGGVVLPRKGVGEKKKARLGWQVQFSEWACVCALACMYINI